MTKKNGLLPLSISFILFLLSRARPDLKISFFVCLLPVLFYFVYSSLSEGIHENKKETLLTGKSDLSRTLRDYKASFTGTGLTENERQRIEQELKTKFSSDYVYLVESIDDWKNDKLLGGVRCANETEKIRGYYKELPNRFYVIGYNKGSPIAQDGSSYVYILNRNGYPECLADNITEYIEKNFPSFSLNQNNG